MAKKRSASDCCGRQGQQGTNSFCFRSSGRLNSSLHDICQAWIMFAPMSTPAHSAMICRRRRRQQVFKLPGRKWACVGPAAPLALLALLCWLERGQSAASTPSRNQSRFGAGSAPNHRQSPLDPPHPPHPAASKKLQVQQVSSARQPLASQRASDAAKLLPAPSRPNNQAENATQLAGQLQSASYPERTANHPLDQTQPELAWPLPSPSAKPIGAPDWLALVRAGQDLERRALELADQQAYLDAQADLYQMPEHPSLIDISSAKSSTVQEPNQVDFGEESDQAEREPELAGFIGGMPAEAASEFSVKKPFQLASLWARNFWFTTIKPQKLAKRRAVTRPSIYHKRLNAPIITPVNFIVPSMSLMPATTSTMANPIAKPMRRQHYLDDLIYSQQPDVDYLPANYYGFGPRARRQLGLALGGPRAPLDADRLPARVASSGLVSSTAALSRPSQYDSELVGLFEEALNAAVQDQAAQVLAASPVASKPSSPVSTNQTDSVQAPSGVHALSSPRKPSAWISLDGRQIYYNGSVPPSDIGLYLATSKKKAHSQRKRKPKIIKLSNSQLIDSSSDLQPANTVHHVKQLLGQDDDDEDDDADVNVRLLTRASRATSPASMLISLAFLILSNVSLAATVIAHGISAFLNPQFNQSNHHSASSTFGQLFPLFGRGFLFRSRTTTRRPRQLDAPEEDYLQFNATGYAANITRWASTEH